MILESVTLRDFRQYRGENTAQIAVATGDDNDRNVTVFHGANGAGKTSLFSAVNWCLYDYAGSDTDTLVNRALLAETPVNGEATASVTIAFRNKGARYIAARFVTVRKVSAQNETRVVDNAATLARINEDGNHENLTAFAREMNEVLPKNVRPYFFFDGEKLEDLMRAGNDGVKDAIRNLMRLPALERAASDLQTVADGYRREVGRQGGGKLEELTREMEQAQSERNRLRAERDRRAGEVATATQRIGELEDKLRQTAGVRELQRERDDIKRRLGDLTTRERDNAERIRQILNVAYLPLLAGPGPKALALLDQKREKGEIPSGIREQLVKDLLERHACVCGRAFCDGDDAHERLTALLGRSTTNKMEREVSDLSGALRLLSSRTNEQQETLASLNRERQAIVEQKDDLYNRLDDIKARIGDGGAENAVVETEKLRAGLQNKKDADLMEQGRLDVKIAELDHKIGRLENDQAQAAARNEKVRFSQDCMTLAQSAAAAMAQVKNEFFEQSRRTIEADTKTVFGLLAWKNEQFQDVRIDESFRLEVIDRWGMATKRELSAGERQVLSLAFICALSRKSGEEAPLVIDTPFGRLANDHRGTVCDNLPQIARQLVLFVTDSEWNETVRTRLAPRIGQEYRLSFDTRTGGTSIEPLRQ